MSRNEADLGGIKLSVRDAQMAIGRALLALHRRDHLACETHLIQAQRAATSAELEARAQERGE